ncbi:MAG: hypothetical protein TUN42_08590 [Dehalogenimonas sp.]
MGTDYERNLKRLQDKVLAMGSMVEKAIILSMDSTKERDVALANKVIEDDSLTTPSDLRYKRDASNSSPPKPRWRGTSGSSSLYLT